MYTIGKLAEISQVSVRTLRYYDEIGLLLPSEKNAAGHRFYSNDKVAKLQHILMLRDLGFSLSTILVKKPLALQFAVDFVYLQGMPKKESTALFSKKPIFFWFQLLTGLFFFTSLFQNSFKAWLIHSYGVDGYGEMLLYLKASGWFFYGLSIAGFFLIGHKINNQPEQAGTSNTPSNSQENLQAEKNALSAQDQK